MSDQYADAYARALRTFHVEARDMVEQMEQSLLSIEQRPDDPELLNALFRSVHTIKGSAGLFGLDALVAFTHEVETVLDRLRSGQLQHDGALGSTLLVCADHVANLLDQAQRDPGEPLPPDLHDDGHALLQRLTPYSGRSLPVLTPSAAGGPHAEGVWHISLRFAADSFLHGIDPLATVRYLGTLGELELVETFDDRVPALDGLDPECCYLGFEIRLRSSAGQAALDDAFEFIRDECVVHLIPPQPPAESYFALIDDLPDDATRLGEILVRCGAITAQQLHRALAKQHSVAAEASVPPPLGHILVEQTGIEREVVDAALRKQARSREGSGESRQLRIAAEKLDALINVVGELVIHSATTKLQAQALGATALVESTQQMGRLIEEIRNSALSLRMVPIGESFTRFRRVVRDVAGSLGKDVVLEIDGADTELDKSVVEQISDPLLHLVRNALDHGIEQPAERLAAGKPGAATLRLAARHDSGSIVIEVSDDGRGIDPARILAKARERGLVGSTPPTSEEAVLALIFEPGFSTAEKLSDLSGRGVGMDVVRRNVEALRGSISIHSVLGRGCTMRIRLPLTLAIIDGFLVRCGDSGFVVQLEHVEECIAGSSALSDGRTVGLIDQRGTPLPVLAIGRLLRLREPAAGRRSIVIVRCGERRAGLLVDQLLGEHQTVVKPLGELFTRMRCIAGSTILGNGEVAMILDTAALIDEATRRAALATPPRLAPPQALQSPLAACHP